MYPEISVCSFTLPDWYMPFEARCNPLLDEMRRLGKAWATEMAMI
jgi:hypothetical protein